MYEVFSTITTFLSSVIAFVVGSWVAKKLKFSENPGFMMAVMFPTWMLGLAFFAITCRTGFYFPWMHQNLAYMWNADRIVTSYPGMLINLIVGSAVSLLIGWFFEAFVKD